MPEAAARAPTVALIADDYAQHPGIDLAILDLLRRGRLQGASCLVTMPGWRAAAPALAELAAGRSGPVGTPPQIGLHFNLTDGAPLSPELRRLWPRLPSLGTLLLRAATATLPRAAIASEWQAQSEAFVDAFGRPPDHVDGHQHVHHLPGVRETMLDVVERFGHTGRRPWVRNTGRLRGLGSALKQAVIERSGGRSLAQGLAQRGWPHHRTLLGAYDFQALDIRPLMQAWWREAAAPGAGPALLFCHPAAQGAPAGSTVDPIAAARQREWDYLASAALDDDLAAAGVRLDLGLGPEVGTDAPSALGVTASGRSRPG
jgi:chitin disaccharide deacetylase